LHPPLESENRLGGRVCTLHLDSINSDEEDGTEKKEDGTEKKEVKKESTVNKNNKEVEAEEERVEKLNREENEQLKRRILKENDENKGKEIEEKATNKEKGGDYLELGAQWIHGRGSNPLWKFCRLNGLQFQEAKIFY
jgi:monoamine oxidase